MNTSPRKRGEGAARPGAKHAPKRSIRLKKHAALAVGEPHL
jgi:hypothetical protein